MKTQAFVKKIDVSVFRQFVRFFCPYRTLFWTSFDCLNAKTQQSLNKGCAQCTRKVNTPDRQAILDITEGQFDIAPMTDLKKLSNFCETIKFLKFLCPIETLTSFLMLAAWCLMLAA